ncbi:hypothetical protein MPC4_110162 [Methylocella tundrae]|uniref:Uncharacterized protein n=1 Tax=Methylocella tundrae TaxID=227605 RepID=A0A8B6M411_METTU|nr:hypothetical protein MPC1_7160003 [Methylocella tundrae]VTZ48862.1 hypothetical protein MPC4_110162 [Methylocella tundrae]
MGIVTVPVPGSALWRLFSTMSKIAIVTFAPFYLSIATGVQSQNVHIVNALWCSLL